MADTIDTAVGTVYSTDYEPVELTHRVFLGPKFLFSFFNKNDELHEVSRAVVEFVRNGTLPYRQFITNDHAIDEAATRLKKRGSIRYADLLLRAFEESGLFRLERVPEEAFETACDRFTRWNDNDASFTDFVIASHMEQIGVDHIATYDRHYRLFEVEPLPHTEFE